MRIRRAAAFALVLCLLSGSLVALASEKDEFIDITYVPISGNPFVVDSLNGVGAYYSNSRKYLCVEYCFRYYREVYGVDIQSNGNGPVIYEDGYWFERTYAPKTGDIIFSPASSRAASYNHGAIVKDCTDGVVTIIEQNWKWNGKAAFERKIPVGTKYNRFYTLKSSNTVSEVAVQLAAVTDEPSDWAAGPLQVAAGYGLALESGYRQSITRAEFCKLAVHTTLYLCPDAARSEQSFCFTDTSDEAVLDACRLGLVHGVSETAFSPETPLTRETAATILHRMSGLLGYQYEAPELSDISDFSTVSDWAQESVAAMFGQGILQGDGISINPQSNLTREEAVILLLRLIEN